MSYKDQKSKGISIPQSKWHLFIKRVFPYALSLFLGYIVADLVILSFRSEIFPKERPSVGSGDTSVIRGGPSLERYNTIKKRNIFNSEGLIALALVGENESATTKSKSVDLLAPVATSLPLTLKGTIVHRNPRKSVATILSKGRSSMKATSFQVGEKAYDMIEVLGIQRRRVVFRNLNSGRREYVEIPDESNLSIGYKGKSKKKGKASSPPEGDGEFTIKRSDIDKYTENMSEVLRQARVVPNIGANGKTDGFRFVSIKSGSIYETLGFKVGDIIKEANGQPVSASRAMELYRSIQDSDRLQIVLERDGVSRNNTYSITD